jgi:hypothetical protein
MLANLHILCIYVLYSLRNTKIPTTFFCMHKVPRFFKTNSYLYKKFFLREQDKSEWQRVQKEPTEHVIFVLSSIMLCFFYLSDIFGW